MPPGATELVLVSGENMSLTTRKSRGGVGTHDSRALNAAPGNLSLSHSCLSVYVGVIFSPGTRMRNGEGLCLPIAPGL